MKRVKVRTLSAILVIVLVLALSGASDAWAGRMFGGKSVATPEWCFCARVCAGFTNPPGTSHVPPGQNLQICPQVHDELIYDHQTNCGCREGAPRPNPQESGQRMSPNH